MEKELKLKDFISMFKQLFPNETDEQHKKRYDRYSEMAKNDLENITTIRRLVKNSGLVDFDFSCVKTFLSDDRMAEDVIKTLTEENCKNK